ncbi:MAG TPA: long-chain fatty acid--CoA ligase [Geminicoccaceae bacterium]
MNEVIERVETCEPLWLKSYPPGIGWGFASEPAPLWTLLDAAAAAFPDRRFIDFLDKAWTYGEVARLVDRAAAGFQRIGVRAGTRVGLLLPNCPYFVIAYFAVLKAGGTVVNYNPLYAPPEIERQVVDSGTTIMVTLDLKQLLPKLDGLIGRTPLETVVVARLADALPFPKNLFYPWVKRSEIARFDGGAGNLGFHELILGSAAPEPVRVEPERDVAVLQYTGGTTGVPKAAALTHAALLSNARQLVAWNRLAHPEGERVLGVLPLFHVFALTVVLNYGTAIGAELILLPRFDLAQVLRTIDRKRPTVMPGVPTLYAAINNHPALHRFDLSSLRLCIAGGAAMPLEVKEQFERATGCTVVEGYGLTESPVVTCNPIGGRHKRGSIGLPLPGTALEVVSLEDRTTVLGPGETGEICVRAPQTMTGYLSRAGAEDEALRAGRLHTGDIGYLDDEGYGFVVDRLKDVIICGGFNVYPRTVEEALYQHPAVAEAAVVGVPDAYRGQTVKAYVVRRGGHQLDAPALLAFLKERLSPIEMPKVVEFRNALPKSAVGKILKRELLAAGEAPG